MWSGAITLVPRATVKVSIDLSLASLMFNHSQARAPKLCLHTTLGLTTFLCVVLYLFSV